MASFRLTTEQLEELLDILDIKKGSAESARAVEDLCEVLDVHGVLVHFMDSTTSIARLLSDTSALKAGADTLLTTLEDIALITRQELFANFCDVGTLKFHLRTIIAAVDQLHDDDSRNLE